MFLTKALAVLTAIGAVSSLVLGNLYLSTRDDLVALKTQQEAFKAVLEAAAKENKRLINYCNVNDGVKVDQEQKILVIEEKKDVVINQINNIPKKCKEEVKDEKANVAGIDDLLPPELSRLLSESNN